MVSIEEYPFIFLNTPASLQVLASAEMALSIWRHVYGKTSYKDDKVWGLWSDENPHCKEVLNIPVPRRIRAQIDNKVVKIGKELRRWINFHLHRKLFGNSSEAYVVNRSKHIVVDSSGSIGYKATAVNILNSGEFNDAVNYKISCAFCLEDQVKRFWPVVANDVPIDANSPFDRCNLSYWSGLMNVGNSITDTDNELFILRMKGAEAKIKMSVPLQSGDVPALEYFCKMLPEFARIPKIILWLERNFPNQMATPTRTLSTLDRVQAEKVFEQKASLIFRILIINDYYLQFVHQLWTLMGHLVLKDKSAFSDVVSELWIMAFEPRVYPDCDALDFTRCDQINDLLLEIWSNASDELKAHVSENLWRNQSIFHKSSGFSSYYGHNLTLLLELFSKWRDDKEQLWLKNWRPLALRAKPSYLEQFMRMCLPNDDDIELFKNELADFDELFKSLIDEGFYSDLKDYLLLCSKDAVQFQQLGKHLLESNFYFILIHDDAKFAQFEWFAGEVFANVQKDIHEFKTQMILSAECLMYLLAARQADEITSKDFSRIIRRFVNNEEEFHLVKRKLFEHCHTYPVDYEYTTETFHADQWQEFLEWCTGDPEEISTFKRSLDVDVIFLKHSEDFLRGNSTDGLEVCLHRRYETLRFLDHFFKWYFGNEEDVKNFKLEKVKNYERIDILRGQGDKEYQFHQWCDEGKILDFEGNYRSFRIYRCNCIN